MPLPIAMRLAEYPQDIIDEVSEISQSEAEPSGEDDIVQNNAVPVQNVGVQIPV